MTFALVLLRTFSQLTLEKSQVMLEICEHCLRTFSRVVLESRTFSRVMLEFSHGL